MKLFSVKQIALLDNYTIENEPIASFDLMERASNELFKWICENISYKKFLIIAGTGNNGGDGLALARMLVSKSYEVSVFLLSNKNLSPDCEKNLIRLKSHKEVNVELLSENSFPEIKTDTCIIDALFGSGLNRPLEGLALQVVQKINQSNAFVLSVDIPSGLMGEDNRENNREGIVRAHITLSFEFPKMAFFFIENYPFVGKWHVLPIKLHEKGKEIEKSNYYYATHSLIHPKLKHRNTFDHKGTFGHALICAGSKGKFGAAVFSAKACVSSGAGLTTVYTVLDGMPILQTAVPDAMGIYDDNEEITNSPILDSFNAIALGPGMGTGKNAETFIKQIFANCSLPLVIDADAITVLSKNPELLSQVPENSILTPHPGEFKRLAGDFSDSYSMHEAAIEFSKKYKIILVLKGAYSQIIFPDGTCIFNSTGNPGMAKGGSGDVLTGIIVSLLARGYSPFDASVLGTYIHGLASDIALRNQNIETIKASDLILYLCHAFSEIYRD